MLGSSTVFRRLPGNLDRVQLRFLEGIRFAIETADLSFSRLVGLLADISRRMIAKDDVPPDVFPAAIADAWATTDSMHRLRELLERTPNLKKKEPPVVVFTNEAEKLGELRNSFHHAREDFAKFPPEETAIWGAISWCVPADKHIKCFTLVPGTITSGQYPFVNPLGKVVRSPIDLIALKAFGRTAELSELHRRMGKLANYLESGLVQGTEGMPGSMCDVVASVDIHPSE